MSPIARAGASGRDHSIVIHACRTVEKKMEEDPIFAARKAVAGVK